MKDNRREGQRHLILQPGDGQVFDIAGMMITVKADEGDQHGAFSVFEIQVPPHFAAQAPHFHHVTTEWFYVVRGTLAFTLDDQTIMARAGSFLLIEPGSKHTFWNPTAASAALLGFRSQPNFAEYLAELTQLVAGSPDWPPADMAQVWALAERYDEFRPRTR